MSPMPRSFAGVAKLRPTGEPASKVTQSCLVLMILVTLIVELGPHAGLPAIIASVGFPIVGYAWLRMSRLGPRGVGMLTAALTIAGVLIPGIALVLGAGFMPAVWVGLVGARQQDWKVVGCAVLTMAYSVFLTTFAVISVFHGSAYVASFAIALVVIAAVLAPRRRATP